jgi:dTDP-glucose pyrophosphorylase
MIMQKKHQLDTYIIKDEVNIRKAMQKLDESHRKILFVIQNDYSIVGSLTDGDIRRWILKGKMLNEPVSSVCNLSPICVAPDYSLGDVKQSMLEHKVQAIPVVDSDNKIIDVLFWDVVFDDEAHFAQKPKMDIPVVIMAGGAGTRLDPFTRILPKPLIPIGDKSIIEVIIDKYREYGINDFYVSIYSKAKLIKAYFEEVNPPYKITYLEEKVPLGTVGILSEIKNVIDDSVILTNCDTIIDCDYADLVGFHNNNAYDITLVGSMITTKIPYGICETADGGKLLSLTEKPEYSYLASTGMYVLRKKALKHIPDGKKFNITDLIEVVRASNGSVGVYPISEKSWLDTGEWQEYKKTVELLKV